MVSFSYVLTGYIKVTSFEQGSVGPLKADVASAAIANLDGSGIAGSQSSFVWKTDRSAHA